MPTNHPTPCSDASVLLFDPHPTGLRWTLTGPQRRAVGRVPLGAPDQDLAAVIPLMQAADHLAYVLPNGGEVFPQTRTPLDPAALAALRVCAPLYPAGNGIILRLAELGWRACPQTPQTVLCETALFQRAPKLQRTYALPAAHTLPRAGGAGLFHAWAWDQAAALHIDPQSASTQPASARSLMSVRLGNDPTVAALLDGAMIESSLGFPPVDMIPSASGCGEVDPAVLLELTHGADPQAVAEQLAANAGWSALAGRPLGWSELLAAGDPAAQLASEMTRRALLKWIGAGLTALPVTPAFLFALEDPHPALPWIQALLTPLRFAGVTLNGPVSIDGGWRLSPAGAAQGVWVLPYDRVQHLSELVAG